MASAGASGGGTYTVPGIMYSTQSNGTRFGAVNGTTQGGIANDSASENVAETLVARAGTIKRFVTRNLNATVTATLTLRVNGVDTALTVSYTGVEGVNTLKSSSGAVAVAAGDRWSVKMDLSGTAGNQFTMGVEVA